MRYPASKEEADQIKREARLDVRRTKNILLMHRCYGKKSDHLCGDCKHFRVLEYAKMYYKCDLFRVSHGPATDWRRKWEACGKFEAGE